MGENNDKKVVSTNYIIDRVIELLRKKLTIDAIVIKQGTFQTIVGSDVSIKLGDEILSTTRVVF